MIEQKQTDISNFFVAGINYKKTSADLRGQFSVNTDKYEALIALAPQYNLKEIFILSTCNRTELYGFADSGETLSRLLCTQTQGNFDEFNSMAYIKNGEVAIEHLFNVAAGLDSQILGDYEILGQLKIAVKFSRERGFMGAYLERIVNAVFKASKLIKTNTALSGGTVSVAFAAIQYLKENVADAANKKILLIGTGKIGRNTCKNLIDYIEAKNITLINRTEVKAQTLANELGLRYVSVEDLSAQVKDADIILVATNAAEPVVLKSQLLHAGKKVIIDLSIPFNVEKSVQHLEGITLINVDDLSAIKDATLQKRVASIPAANTIIKEHIVEFFEWHDMRKHAPFLKTVKNKLYAIHSCELYISYSARQQNQSITPITMDRKIQKVMNQMAFKMRFKSHHGCDYINAINEYIATGTN